MTSQLAQVIRQKGRNLEHIPRAPTTTYHQRLSLEVEKDELIIACWGTQFPTTIGPICEKVANNPVKTIEWIYAIKKQTAEELLEK